MSFPDPEILAHLVLAEQTGGQLDVGASRAVADMLQSIVARYQPLDALARIPAEPSPQQACLDRRSSGREEAPPQGS